MKTSRLLGVAAWLLLGAGVTVFGYNVWAYSCGHCTLQTLCSFGPIGWLMLSFTAAAGGSLLWLRRRRLRLAAARCCPCGSILKADWGFCPQCGHQVREVSALG